MSTSYCSKCFELMESNSQEQCMRCGKAKPSLGWPVDTLLGQRILGDQYKVLRLLGVGGFGRVYKVETVVGGLQRAMKVLSAQWAQDEGVQQRFVNEALILERLSHPNISRCYSVGILPGLRKLYMMMEFIEGDTLANRIWSHSQVKGEPLPALEVVRIAMEIASALSAAHSLQVLHRDLKPENILLSPSASGRKQVKLIDFGVAKLLNNGSNASVYMMGTPNFMAPEQFMRDVELDQRLDLWQLGAIMYCMLTGLTPYPGDPQGTNPMASFFQQQQRSGMLGPCPSQTREKLSIHPELDQLVGELLATEREQRPASADEVCDRLALIEDHMCREGEDDELIFAAPSMAFGGSEQVLPQTGGRAPSAPGSQAFSSELLETLCLHPSEEVWRLLCHTFEAKSQTKTSQFSYLLETLESWPDDKRSAPLGWWGHARRGQSPAFWPLVRALKLSGRELNDDDLVQLAENVALRQIKFLDLSFNRFGVRGLRALLASPHLQQLKVLKLDHNVLQRQAFEAFSSASLSQLTTLHLSHTELDDAALSVFLRTAQLPSLQELVLTNNRLTSRGFAALAQAPLCNELRVLNLQGNRCDDAGVTALATGASFERLDSLNLRNTGLQAAGLQALAASVSFKGLRTLDVAQNRLPPEALDAFSRTSFPRLRSLSLGSNGFGQLGAMRLAPNHFLAQLQHLELDDNQLGDVGASVLLSSPFLASLTSLNLAQNGLSSESCALFTGLHCGQLETLDLSRNPLGVEGARHLSAWLPSSSLSTLRVGSCQLGAEGIGLLLCPGAPAPIVHLDVSGNELDAMGCLQLTHGFWDLQLQSLDLSHNPLRAQGLRALMQVSGLASLRSLSLNNCQLGDVGIHSLVGVYVVSHLRDLALQYNGITPEGIATLVTSSLRKRLSSLDLGYNEIGDEGVSILSVATGFSRLHKLDLRQNAIGLAGMARLAASSKLRALQELNLHQNARTNVVDLHSLDKSKIKQMEESFGMLASRGGMLASRFYDELFTRYPSVKPLFANTSMPRQRQHLVAALSLVIENLRHPEQLAPKLRMIGQRHIGYGAQPSHYFAVIDTLMDVMREFLPEQWNPTLQDAWTEGLQAICNIMLEGQQAGLKAQVAAQSASGVLQDVSGAHQHAPTARIAHPSHSMGNNHEKTRMAS